MTINTRRLRASLPAVSEPRRAQPTERSTVLWLLVFLPVAFIFAIHFISDILARG